MQTTDQAGFVGMKADRNQVDLQPFGLEHDVGARNRQFPDPALAKAAADHDAFGVGPRLGLQKTRRHIGQFAREFLDGAMNERCSTDIMLKADGFKVDLRPIRFDPDEAGLIGCLHLAPSWIFEAYDSILAVDIGGTNIRCGVVETRWKKAPDLSKASVWKSDLWRHADDEPTREGAVKRLTKMLKELIADADSEGFKLAPFVGIACPGVINEDGSIAKGAQNLPGNWESSKFNLPASLVEAIPMIGDHDTAVLMHNDGVAQGLSEVPFMQDVERWGVLTIGTGLGNARFTNRRKESGKENGKGKAKDEKKDSKPVK